VIHGCSGMNHSGPSASGIICIIQMKLVNVWSSINPAASIAAQPPKFARSAHEQVKSELGVRCQGPGSGKLILDTPVQSQRTTNILGSCIEDRWNIYKSKESTKETPLQWNVILLRFVAHHTTWISAGTFILKPSDRNA
jgi:hypothetical protein